MSREEIEKEVNEDLSKSYHQLLLDVHEELLNKNRALDDNVRHAQKRIMSLFARMGSDSARAQVQMRNLTYAIIALAILQIIIQIVISMCGSGK